MIYHRFWETIMQKLAAPSIVPRKEDILYVTGTFIAVSF